MREVCRSDQYALEVFHFLQENILHGIQGLDRLMAVNLLSFTEHGVGFVEEQDRRRITAFHHFAVVVENPLDAFFALPEPHAFGFGDIDFQDVAAALPGQLIDRFGLAGPGSSVEERRKTAAQTFLL